MTKRTLFQEAAEQGIVPIPIVAIPEGVDPERFRELVERLLNQRLAEASERETSSPNEPKNPIPSPYG